MTEFMLRRDPRERGLDAEDAVYAFLSGLGNVTAVQRAKELWAASHPGGGNVPYTLLREGSEETVLCPDFLVTLDTGHQRWVECKSAFHLGEWHWGQYSKLAKAQPYRPMRFYFAIEQGGGEWYLYHCAEEKLAYSKFHYEADSPYYDIKMGCCTGPVSYTVEEA